MFRFITLILLGLSLWGMPSAIGAPTVSANAEAALKASLESVGRTVGPHLLRDQDGTPVDIASFRGKPLVISMVYTACDHTCPVTTQTVAKAVEMARKSLGRDGFHVVTIGFDTVRDTPEALRMYAKQHDIGLDGWTFLAGDAATMEALAANLGFTWFVTSRGFDHIAQTTVIDADGVIYRQVYGENFEIPLLVEPLKDLLLGRVSAALDSVEAIGNRIRYFCTVYDPRSDAYRFDYGIILSIAFGFLAVLTIIVWTFRLWRESRSASGS